MSKPLAIDLCCGLTGWGEGLIAEGWRVRGYDTKTLCEIERRAAAEAIERLQRGIG